MQKSVANFWNLRGHYVIEGGLIKQRFLQDEFLPDSFNLLSWNVFKGHGDQQYFLDLSHLYAISDVMCLQEVPYKQSPLLPEKLKSINYDYGISYTKQNGDSEGVMTLSGYHLHAQAQRVLTKGREPVARTPKVAVSSYFPSLDGETIQVINLHSLLIRSPARLATELEHIADEVSRWCERCLIVGDFNTFHQRYLNRLKGVLEPMGFRWDAPIWDPRSKVKRLDHIFSRGFKEVHVSVLDHIKSSDHLPILCRINV